MGIIVLGMNDTLGVLLKRVRERVGMTQEVLAVKAKVSASTVARLESGKSATTDVANLLAFAEVLQVHPCELLGIDYGSERSVPYRSLQKFLDGWGKRMRITETEKKWLSRPLPGDHDIGGDDFWLGLLAIYRQAAKASAAEAPTDT